MRRKSHVRFRAGENPEITSKDYLSLFADFTGLSAGHTYYPILKYEHTYRVISRDITSIDLSTLLGQTLDSEYIADEAADGHVTYDSSSKKASITGITGNAHVTFSVEQAQDTITFIGNEGDATTAPAILSSEAKIMPASAINYGELATAALVGYTFVGWFTEAEDGVQVTEDTLYESGVSVRTLYAHWTPNTDTQYKIQHWVEYIKNGENVRYEKGVTETKVDNGITYYLYETSNYADGTSDHVKDISSLDLKNMSDTTVTWWARNGFTARFENPCKVLANGSSIFSVYYGRNVYELTFDPSGEGSATSSSVIPNKDAKFGAPVGNLDTPALPGYSFGGWYDGDRLVTSTTIYNKAEGGELVAHWNANDNTNWAIKIATQDLYKDPVTGVYSGAGTYTEYKTVYKNDAGVLLSHELEGTSDTNLEFNISSLSALTFEGFKYAGYADSYNKNADNMTAATDKAVVKVKPTDASTEKDGKFNEDFDGGIVWLYYDRKTKTVEFSDPTQSDETLGDDSEIIYGGDFTGKLPPDPSKDGYDFNGWVDKDGDPIDENTPAEDYIGNDDKPNPDPVPDPGPDDPIVIIPTWTARDYILTYVPGDKAMFVASDGGKGTKDNKVPGGYQDSHAVTYDKPMGKMPIASKTGYTFDGWFLEDNTQITSDTVVAVDNVIVHNDDFLHEGTRPMHAHYTPHTYTLVLDPRYSPVTGKPGTVDPKRVNVTFDEIISGLPVPALDGYTFVSWVLDPQNPTTAFKNGDTWTEAYTNGAEVPVYATWIPNSYKYTFDLNDDEGSTKGMLVDAAVDYTEEVFDSIYNGIVEVEAVRPGYDFRGWSLTEDGDVLTAEDIVGLAKDTTVYAIWTPKEYMIKFIMKGAEMPEEFKSDPAAIYAADKDTWTIKVKFDSTYGTLPVPTKPDSKYNGWLVTAPHWDALDNDIILELPAYTDYKDESGIVLKAVMEPWITFDLNGNTFNDDTIDPKKELQSEIDTLPEVKKPDYTFDGWTKEDDPETLDNESDKVLTIEDVKELEDPVVLKPKFSANVTFDANGGTVNGQANITVGLSKISSLPSASRSSCKFDGWFTSVEGGAQVSLQSLRTANVPTTVYAHWSVVTLSGGGGGGGGGGAITPSYTITIEEEDGSTTTPNGKVKVPEGGDKKFEFKADDGYTIVDVIIDGLSQGVVSSYEFRNVKEDHTVVVKTAKLLTGDHIAYINGYPDGSVRPEANITRAEVAAICYRLMTEEARAQFTPDTDKFSDLNTTWASEEIALLAAAGILKGYDDGTFRPNEKITRAECAAVAARFDKLKKGKSTFSDVPKSHWAYDVIASAAEKGWVSGYPDGTFRPDNKITRAEVVKIANAMLARSCDEDYAKAHDVELKNFNDITPVHWAYLDFIEASNAHDYEKTEIAETWTALK